jgi:cellulose biosynthesis protein BcsQ
VRVVAAYNIKGGVGKTTTAVNLARLCAAEGARTLLWDLDPQGASSFYFRIQPRVKGGVKWLLRGRHDFELLIRGTDFELLDLLPADFSYRHLDLFLDRTEKPLKGLSRLIKPLRGLYDWLFLDCPPGISLVSENVFVAAEALVVPTIPTPLSLRTLAQLHRYLEKMQKRRPRVLPFFNMVDVRRGLHREIVDPAGRDAAGFLPTRIPYLSIVEQMGQKRAPLLDFAPRSEASRAFERLWGEVRGSIEAVDAAAERNAPATRSGDHAS